jgi:hypothetical protein
VIRVYDDAGNVIETHEHNGEFGCSATAELQRKATAIANIERVIAAIR